MQRHPELWWLVSIAAIVTVGIAVGSSVSGTFHNEQALPATSPAALVAEVQGRTDGGYSGTITSQVDLELPVGLQSALVAAVPAAGIVLNGDVHTVQYWYGGKDKQRVAVRLRGSEQDVFRNGSQLLTWDTSTGVARTSTVPKSPESALPLSVSTPLSLTPPQFADALLDRAGDDSDTSLRSGDTIAGRDTYELILRPRSSSSRIGEVQIQVDGTSFVPLGVKVFARDAEQPSIDITFTAIRFADPAERNFTFTPPDGVTPRGAAASGTLAATLGSARTQGTGWTSIAAIKGSIAESSLVADVLGNNARSVRGKWGRGTQLCVPVVCVLVTSKGTVLAGAVEPETLYAAVG